MPIRQTNKMRLLISLAMIPVCGLVLAAPAPHAAPANAPAEVTWKSSNGSLKMRYSDTTILEAKVFIRNGADERAAKRDEGVLAQSVAGSNKVEQVLRLAARHALGG